MAHLLVCFIFPSSTTPVTVKLYFFVSLLAGWDLFHTSNQRIRMGQNEAGKRMQDNEGEKQNIEGTIQGKGGTEFEGA